MAGTRIQPEPHCLRPITVLPLALSVCTCIPETENRACSNAPLTAVYALHGGC